MQDARYFRDQAALCLEIARQMSDRQASERLRADAANYFARATMLEGRTEAAGPPTDGPRAEER
jgi:hypothetical protein